MIFFQVSDAISSPHEDKSVIEQLFRLTISYSDNEVDKIAIGEALTSLPAEKLLSIVKFLVNGSCDVKSEYFFFLIGGRILSDLPGLFKFLSSTCHECIKEMDRINLYGVSDRSVSEEKPLSKSTIEFICDKYSKIASILFQCVCIANNLMSVDLNFKHLSCVAKVCSALSITLHNHNNFASHLISSIPLSETKIARTTASTLPTLILHTIFKSIIDRELLISSFLGFIMNVASFISPFPFEPAILSFLSLIMHEHMCIAHSTSVQYIEKKTELENAETRLAKKKGGWGSSKIEKEIQKIKPVVLGLKEKYDQNVSFASSFQAIIHHIASCNAKKNKRLMRYGIFGFSSPLFVLSASVPLLTSPQLQLPHPQRLDGTLILHRGAMCLLKFCDSMEIEVMNELASGGLVQEAEEIKAQQERLKAKRKGMLEREKKREEERAKKQKEQKKTGEGDTAPTAKGPTAVAEDELAMDEAPIAGSTLEASNASGVCSTDFLEDVSKDQGEEDSVIIGDSSYIVPDDDEVVAAAVPPKKEEMKKEQKKGKGKNVSIVSVPQQGTATTTATVTSSAASASYSEDLEVIGPNTSIMMEEDEQPHTVFDCERLTSLDHINTLTFLLAFCKEIMKICSKSLIGASELRTSEMQQQEIHPLEPSSAHATKNLSIHKFPSNPLIQAQQHGSPVSQPAITSSGAVQSTCSTAPPETKAQVSTGVTGEKPKETESSVAPPSIPSVTSGVVQHASDGSGQSSAPAAPTITLASDTAVVRLQIPVSYTTLSAAEGFNAICGIMATLISHSSGHLLSFYTDVIKFVDFYTMGINCMRLWLLCAVREHKAQNKKESNRKESAVKVVDVFAGEIPEEEGREGEEEDQTEHVVDLETFQRNFLSSSIEGVLHYFHHYFVKFDTDRLLLTRMFGELQQIQNFKKEHEVEFEAARPLLKLLGYRVKGEITPQFILFSVVIGAVLVILGLIIPLMRK
ncbi:hypothetical protein ADUPG1_008100 [Aduncisulcus paluster]|uniref:Uncharacterized protein n=1 Tax=Aduncisulcus paluster TaxID=2918883 RepID=A0ABQ5KS35_9EUKA|nr:hypothetical protein ADUPG1_008100 [Aduncisulcus paluster]